MFLGNTLLTILHLEIAKNLLLPVALSNLTRPRLPAEFKHINKRKKRNQQWFPSTKYNSPAVKFNRNDITWLTTNFMSYRSKWSIDYTLVVLCCPPSYSGCTWNLLPTFISSNSCRPKRFLCLRPTKCGRRHNAVRASLRPSVRPCVRPETLFSRYLAEYLTHFHQTYVNDALWDGDESTIWGQTVKGQGHGGIKHAGNSTFWAC